MIMDIRFDLPAIVIVTDRGFKDYADEMGW